MTDPPLLRAADRRLQRLREEHEAELHAADREIIRQAEVLKRQRDSHAPNLAPWIAAICASVTARATLRARWHARYPHDPLPTDG